jgi:hypothetical protein
MASTFIRVMSPCTTCKCSPVIGSPAMNSGHVRLGLDDET